MNQGSQHCLSDYDIYTLFLKGNRITKEIFEKVNQYVDINRQQLYRLKKSCDKGTKKAVGKEPYFTREEQQSWGSFILRKLEEKKMEEAQEFLRQELSKKKSLADLKNPISIKYVCYLKKILKDQFIKQIRNIDKTTKNSNPLDQSNQLESNIHFSGMSDESSFLEIHSSNEPYTSQFSESPFGEYHRMNEISHNQNITPHLTSNYEEIHLEEKRIQTRDHLNGDSFYQTPQQQGFSPCFSNENLEQEKINHEEELNQSELDKPPISNEYVNFQDSNESEINYLDLNGQSLILND